MNASRVAGERVLKPSPARSRNMAAIRGRDTKPEMIVRRLLHAAGFRYRLHRKDLRIVLENAHQLGLALPGTALVAQHLNALMGSDDGELDSAAIVKVVERMSEG